MGGEKRGREERAVLLYLLVISLELTNLNSPSRCCSLTVILATGRRNLQGWTGKSVQSTETFAPLLGTIQKMANGLNPGVEAVWLLGSPG